MKIPSSKYFFSILLISMLSLGGIIASVYSANISSFIQANVLNQTQKVKIPRLKKTISRLKSAAAAIAPQSFCSLYDPANEDYQAEFINIAPKITVPAGGRTTIEFYVKNTGSAVWFGDSSNCGGAPLVRLGTARAQDKESVFFNPSDNRWKNQHRIAMLDPFVRPGEIASFKFEIAAPNTNDIFREYFQLVAEGKKWLSSPTAIVYADIYTGDVNPEEEQKLIYINSSMQTSALSLNGEPTIEVNLGKQELVFKIGETIVRQYKVSTGAYKTPTPKGTFRILEKSELRIGAKAPHYRMPKWQHFSGRGHGLHALPYLANDRGVFWKEALGHIGIPVSHGCIRLLPQDAEDLYQLTQVGTKMVIKA